MCWDLLAAQREFALSHTSIIELDLFTWADKRTTAAIIFRDTEQADQREMEEKTVHQRKMGAGGGKEVGLEKRKLWLLGGKPQF